MEKVRPQSRPLRQDGRHVYDFADYFIQITARPTSLPTSLERLIGISKKHVRLCVDPSLAETGRGRRTAEEGGSGRENKGLDGASVSQLGPAGNLQKVPGSELEVVGLIRRFSSSSLYPIDPLVVPWVPFDVAQVQET